MKFIQKSIGKLLEETAKKYWNRDALIHSEIGVRYNYALLSWEVDRVSQGFIKSGIQRGDKVAIWAPNIPKWIISFLGLASMGAITVPIDPNAKRDDLFYILKQSECKSIIIAGDSEEDKYINTALYAKTNISSLNNIIVIADKSHPEMISWNELTSMGEKIEKRVFLKAKEAVDSKDPVAIMYTSGTTGKPKGVVLDHLGLINKSMFSTERQGINQKDRLSLFFPLFHMFGNTCIALAGLIRGAALIMPCQTFDPAKILRAMYNEKCTAVYGSPSMIIALIDHPDFQKSMWTSVVKGIIGGAPCPMELMRRLVEDIGVSHITVAYGITETSSWITMTNPDDPIDLRVSTIGTPLACNEIKIVDPATGKDIPFRTQGELCTRGFLMKEYYRKPAATAAAIDRENWFHTGDLGEMDEKNYVKITGRLKDVIVRDGIEIYPVEVEEIIYTLPEVSETQVFGFPHPKKGQEVAAWVKLKEGSRLTLDELTKYVKNNLDAKIAPRYLKIVSDFPMTGSGKVQKFKLAEMAQREHSGEYESAMLY